MCCFLIQPLILLRDSHPLALTVTFPYGFHFSQNHPLGPSFLQTLAWLHCQETNTHSFPLVLLSYPFLCHFDNILRVILYGLHVYLLTFSLKKSTRPRLPFLLCELNVGMSQTLFLSGVQCRVWHIGAQYCCWKTANNERT